MIDLTKFPFRIHKYHSAQDKFYVVEERVQDTDQWAEVRIAGKRLVRLTFSDPVGASAFIEALDGHRGGYVREALIEAMVAS